jgi:hypothetical protein
MIECITLIFHPTACKIISFNSIEMSCKNTDLCIQMKLNFDVLNQKYEAGTHSVD